MISPDTNVLVRILTNDDEQQAAVATEVLRSNDLYIAKTVILELEWVLRFSYGFDRASVNRALMFLMGLENAVVEDAGTVERALERHAEGMDFADALHVESSTAAKEFVTFDRRLAAAFEGRTSSPALLVLDARD
jgi:predicted nucleic-acid-binding protein